MEIDEWDQREVRWARSSIQGYIEELARQAATHPAECELCIAELKDFNHLLRLSSQMEAIEVVDLMRKTSMPICA